MNAQVIGFSHEELSVFEYEFGDTIKFWRVIAAFNQKINFLGRQAKHFSQLSNNASFLEGDVGAEQGDVLKTVEDILRHGRAVAPWKINIKIRGIGPV